MSGWQNFWTVFLFVGMGIYVIVFVVVALAGAEEAKQLLSSDSDKDE